LSVSKLADASAAYNRIIDLYIALDRMKDAEIWCRQAVSFDREYSAQSDPVAKKRLIKMAWIYTRLGRTDDACRIYNSSVHQEKEQAAFMRPVLSQGVGVYS
jgi:tetratricopeptide (TPR) repeat protein